MNNINTITNNNDDKDKLNTIETLVTINRVIYPKNSTGNCWGIVNAHILEDYTKDNSENPNYLSNNITLKGDLPEIDYGQTYKVVAQEIIDNKYGLNYVINMMLPYNSLKDEKQWKLFLSTIISPLQVENMFATLESPMTAIVNKDIQELCKVKGIKEYTANHIIEKYEENKIYGEAFAELVKYNISVTLIKKIVDKYHSINTALNIIRNNPYRLAIDVDGIGFETSDLIGKKIGIPNDDTNRIKSFIYYWLSTQAPEGNSWVLPNVLCEVVTSYLNLTNKDNFRIALKEMKDENLLYWDLDKNFICLKKYYDLELNIVNELKRLYDTKKEFKVENFENTMKETELSFGYTFKDEQIQSARNIINNPINIVYGSAGTGKTTSSRLALENLKDNYSIKACSFSGKASYRIYEATGFKGATIHSTLEYNPKFNAFMRNKDLPLNCDIMLIDECSFLDEELFYALLQALPNGCKLIMLGDPNQLEPIGIGNLFVDMISSGVICCNKLTQIHRQAAKSGIITEANLVAKGIQITNKSNDVQTFGELQDFSLVTADSENLQDIVIRCFKKEYEKYKDITKIQGLGALRTRGTLSLQILNDKIQQWYNPITNKDDVITCTRNGKEVCFHKGDKVINTKNNYHIYNVDGEICILYNGMTGIISDVNTQERSLIVNFGNDIGSLIIESDDIPNIELAYFCTIFKYQGSECESCVIALDMSAYSLLTKNLIYTGLTRAKKRCIMICDYKALKIAIGTNKVIKKQTFLCDLLKEKFGDIK